MRKVKSGDPLVIPAETFNTFIDAARDVRGRQHSQGRRVTPPIPDPWTVRVKNATGAALDRFAVVGLGEPLILPADSEAAFKSEPLVFKADVPAAGTHEGRWAVCAEPIPDAALGRARLLGVVQVRVEIVDEDHRFAEITDADATKLTSAPVGSARILWAESGTGEKWGVVCLQSPPAAPPVVELTADPSGGSATVDGIDGSGTLQGETYDSDVLPE
jgi:hypothetical protein